MQIEIDEAARVDDEYFPKTCSSISILESTAERMIMLESPERRGDETDEKQFEYKPSEVSMMETEFNIPCSDVEGLEVAAHRLMTISVRPSMIERGAATTGTESASARSILEQNTSTAATKGGKMQAETATRTIVLNPL